MEPVPGIEPKFASLTVGGTSPIGTVDFQIERPPTLMTVASRRFCSKIWSGSDTNFDLHREGKKMPCDQVFISYSHEDKKWLQRLLLQ
jgi:hypothetical protein